MTTTMTMAPIQKRVFTIAGRDGLAIVTDSKTSKFKKFEASSTMLACLKALNYELNRMPKAKLDFRVAYLLPKAINFLSYEDTRNFWLTYGYKKSEFNPETNELVAKVNSQTGEIITPEPINAEILEEVRIFNEIMEIQKENVQLFRQDNLTSPLYNSYRNATWATLDRLDQNVVSCNY